jgi:hypothetical protein
MRTKCTTVDVQAKEWFDKVNGNSYFAIRVTVNYGLKSEQTFVDSMQYGYGDQYEYEAFKLLQKHNIVKAYDQTVFWRYYQDKNIIYRHSKQDRCKKSEVIKWGE